MNVGFIGLGNMGRRIADAQLAAGLGMTVWARNPSSLEPYAETSVEVAASPAEVGAAADVVGICVWDEHDVDEVLLGDQGVFAGLRPGGVVAIHSTIAPEACARLETIAASLGCGLVDAPVSIGARAPRLLVMVGGEVAAVQRCLPVFDAFGDPVLHLGPIGSGQVGKLVNNALLSASIGLGDSAVELGVDLGLDRASLVAALAAGSAGGTWSSFMSRRPTDPAMAGRTDEWARKDVGLALDLTSRHGLSLNRPVLEIGAVGADVVEGKRPQERSLNEDSA